MLDRSGWRDLTYLRQLFVCYWRQERYEDIQDLLQNAGKRPGFDGHFVLEHAAAIFYSALLHVDEESAKGPAHMAELRAKSLYHARRAAALWQEAERSMDIQTLANLFLESDAPEEAMLFLRKVRAEDRFQTPKTDMLLVQALQRSGSSDEALAMVEELSGTDLENPYGYVELGRFYLDLDMPEEAAPMFERALVAFPRALEIRFRLAYIYLFLEAPRQALAVMAPVKRLPAQGHMLFAHIYRRLEKKDLSLQALQEAEKVAAEEETPEVLDIDFRLFYAALCDDMGRT